MKAMISGLMDNSLVYTDYDGVLKTKADFLASGKAVGHRPEQQVTESMKAHVYGDAAVVTGVYRVKRLDQGKPYQRRAASRICGFVRTGHGCA